jgi:hypothetical protein
MLTLPPKCVGANKLQQYRPICLLNVDFKIFTKVINFMGVIVDDKITTDNVY